MRAAVKTLHRSLKKAEVITSPLGVLMDVVGLLQFAVPPLAALVGLRKIFGSSIGLPSFPLPMRLLLLIVAISVPGALLGLTLACLTRRISTATVIAGQFLSIGWAVLLVSIVDVLATATGDGAALEFTMFLLIGLGIMLMILTFQLCARSGGSDVQTVRDRSLTIFIVAASAVAMAVLVQIGSSL